MLIFQICCVAIGYNEIQPIELVSAHPLFQSHRFQKYFSHLYEEILKKKLKAMNQANQLPGELTLDFYLKQKSK